MSSIADMPWGVLVLVLMAAAMVIIAVLSSRSGTDSTPRSLGNDGRGPYRVVDTPLPPKIDDTYKAPVSQAASAQAGEAEEPHSPAGRARPPRRIVHCPRCHQAILNDASLAEQRVACPVCNCKFFLPRDT